MSWRTIGAIAVMLFASAMMGIAVHHLLESGNCSTTGYTRYGPAPHCSSSSVAWGIVLPIGLFVVIVAGAVGAPNLFVLLGPLFLMFGLGALTAGSGSGSSGPPPAFDLIFGGCFAVAGAALLAVPAWSALKRSRERQGTGSPARAVVAIVAWVGALAIALAVASLFPSDQASRAAAAAEAADAFFQPPTLSPSDPSSLYRTANFKRALTIAGVYLGADGNVRFVRLVPGGVDIGVALGPRGLRGKEISIDNTGGYLSGPVVALTGRAHTYPLSTLDPSTPAALVARLAAAGELAGARIDHLLARAMAGDGIAWLVYPMGGGPPYRAGNGAAGPITITTTGGRRSIK